MERPPATAFQEALNTSFFYHRQGRLSPEQRMTIICRGRVQLPVSVTRSIQRCNSVARQVDFDQRAHGRGSGGEAIVASIACRQMPMSNKGFLKGTQGQDCTQEGVEDRENAEDC